MKPRDVLVRELWRALVTNKPKRFVRAVLLAMKGKNKAKFLKKHGIPRATFYNGMQHPKGLRLNTIIKILKAFK